MVIVHLQFIFKKIQEICKLFRKALMKLVSKIVNHLRRQLFSLLFRQLIILKDCLIDSQQFSKFIKETVIKKVIQIVNYLERQLYSQLVDSIAQCKQYYMQFMLGAGKQGIVEEQRNRGAGEQGNREVEVLRRIR